MSGKCRRLEERVCVVTGSGRGIGRAIALRLAQEGASVVVTYHQNESAAQSVAKEISKMSSTCMVGQLDVTNRESIRRMRNETLTRFGRIHVLVNNAGALKQTGFLQIKTEEWNEMFEVNLLGVFLCCQEFIPYLILQPGGRIINVASFAGKFGGPKAPHYSAAKAGVICLTKSLARLFSPQGLFVNAVAPGVIATDMFAGASKIRAGKVSATSEEDGSTGTMEDDILLGRVGEPSDVANVVAFLASSDSDYVTGATFDINGGLFLG